MQSTIGRLAGTALMATFVVTWSAHTDRDVAVAQTRAPVMVTRIYTGPDGLSRSEQVEMKLNGSATEMIAATGVQFSSRLPGPMGDWHTGPRRQYVITISGRGELVLGDGTVVPTGPGHINLIEDTTGQGHKTRNIGPDSRIVVTIPLADQRVGCQ